MVYNNVVVLELANYYSFSPFDKECGPYSWSPHAGATPFAERFLSTSLIVNYKLTRAEIDLLILVIFILILI